MPTAEITPAPVTLITALLSELCWLSDIHILHLAIYPFIPLPHPMPHSFMHRLRLAPVSPMDVTSCVQDLLMHLGISPIPGLMQEE